MAKIYIAASFRNQHAVEMLTALLREKEHTVLSFVENNHGEGQNHIAANPMPFEQWVESSESNQCFVYDTIGAITADLVIYIAPSGKDAAAEVGAAWGRGTPIIGLMAKGEDFGLMRKMVREWFYNYRDLVANVNFILRDTEGPKVLPYEPETIVPYKPVFGHDDLPF